MARINNKTVRIDPLFRNELDELAQIRVNKGLARMNDKTQISPREMTRLLRNTSGWRISKEELKTKPRKEDLF